MSRCDLPPVKMVPPLLAMSRASWTTFLGACIGSGAGFPLGMALAVWGWQCLVLMLAAMAATAAAVEGVHHRW